MDENSPKNVVNNTHFLAAIQSLLESITDKDEFVRNAVENALVRMIEARPDQIINALCDFRNKQPKLNDQAIVIILRVFEKFTLTDLKHLSDEALMKLISFAIAEITKTMDQCVPIQKPGSEIIVALGRVHCQKVLDQLFSHLQQGHVSHFMILHCMGAIASVNVTGITSSIKPTLENILPTLSMIKLDHVKQAFAFAIGRFAEAMSENLSQNSSDSTVEDISAELAIAYEVLIHQWLPNRELKVSSEILQALSYMYPLLSKEKIQDQANKVILQILSFYRRSMDRNAITQLLASVLKTTIDSNPKTIDPLSDGVISSLFDLVCVNPDYEKPQTVKSHYESLRCFNLLIEIYSTKIFDMLSQQMRSNNERERIKSLLVLTHLTNTYHNLVAPKIVEFAPLLKHMIQQEKNVKMKMILLKTIVALTEKSLIEDKEFIRFILRNSCKVNKFNLDYGTLEEHSDFILACNASLYMLASTVGTIDEILKRELLSHYLVLEYTDICSTIAKCLSKLFSKNAVITEESKGDGEELSKTSIPGPEAVFARSLTLMGNIGNAKQIENILSFLKFYAPCINKFLQPRWLEKIPELILCLTKSTTEFEEKLFEFLRVTIKDVDDYKFPESLVNKLSDQIVLYPINAPQSEYFVPKFSQEKGMLLKMLGIALQYVTDIQSIETKIDLIFNVVRQEKVIDKNSTNGDIEVILVDAARSLGFISKVHLDIVLQKINSLVQEEGSRKSPGSFFSGLNFMKDNQKESDMFKINVLALESYAHIVQTAPHDAVLKDIDSKMVYYLVKQLCETKDFTLRKSVLSTLLIISEQILIAKDVGCDLATKTQLLDHLLQIDTSTENLPLFPLILKIATNLVKIRSQNQDDQMKIQNFFEEECRKFFSVAQMLKNKFDSVEDDNRNSFLAKYLNLSLPELNAFLKAVFEQNASPSTLDDINCVLEMWIRDKNSEVRICAGHVMNNSLEVYIKTVKIGCEAPSKFNQTGAMLGKIVPRCIDSNATVRQISIDILQKILEISCIYESLTIADSETDWVKELHRIRNEIITDDPKEIYILASDIARIISLRITNFQYMQFAKTLLYCLHDTEESSAIGASVVLKFFMQIKGAELFHSIPEYVKDSLMSINTCTIARARSGVLKSLVALTKHHPKLVCAEIFSQPIPFEANVIEFWRMIGTDRELSGTIIDNFLATLSSSCIYESSEGPSERHHIATVQPFAILCALHEMMPCKEILGELKQRFAELFCMYLTFLATYTNIAPPMVPSKSPPNKGNINSGKAKFGFIPNKDSVKMNPCLIVLETFQSFLKNLDMEQIHAVLTVCPVLATSTELNNFIEILTPLAIGLVNQLGINSTSIKQIVTCLSKYVSSPYDSQRIAAVGVYSQLIPLKPSGEIASVIMLHLSAALGDPNPLVRGFAIRGLAYIGDLSEHDINKYLETSLSALLKGIDDFNANCFINIPLESMRGLSRVLTSVSGEKIDNFQVSLAIRIRPFFENPAPEIREAAILLFGDLCKSKLMACEDGADISSQTSEALKEQLLMNFFSLLLHLCESDGQIIRACKITLRKVCILINAPKVNSMVQSHLLEYGQLNYDMFINDFIKLIAVELCDNIPDFIESCVPFLKSTWSEIRGNAAVIIGLLQNANKTNQQQTTESVGQKIAILLKDDHIAVRVKAATALGYMFGNLL
ncbi:Maestro heat-like repeat-containing protein family member 1 [Pseudolycoriella hygida]|uniref:Maestro heat-like repeat-containing protein family member 1 n=1 Tax=Pseudolycoriella hygida TaxID=35572 RepID=A0A9Q0MX25_9DIPT|nr:Maestro heat-like repeat-containing protein family member 1 [Pseudolycoriella hygida]